MHILICEREHFIRRALSEHLVAQGYQVSEAGTEAECLELVTRIVPDFMLLDDPKLAKKLKRQKIAAPIIMMTSAQIPGYEHIPKPYELADVSALLQTKLGHFGQKQA